MNELKYKEIAKKLFETCINREDEYCDGCPVNNECYKYIEFEIPREKNIEYLISLIWNKYNKKRTV